MQSSILNSLVKNLLYTFNTPYPTKDLYIVYVNSTVVSTKYEITLIINHEIAWYCICPSPFGMHT